MYKNDLGFNLNPQKLQLSSDDSQPHSSIWNIGKWNVTHRMLLLSEMSTFDEWSGHNPRDLYTNCTSFMELKWICRLSKGKTFIHCLVTVGAALCYSFNYTHRNSQTHPETRNSCSLNTSFCSACKSCLNSYNSARWQVRRRRRRCWFPFLCGFQTTLACQRCHIKTLREPSLSQRFDGWKDRWADRWLHR